MLPSKVGKFLRKLKSRKGYTLIEAATVVAITGAMALVAVPIASEKIEDSKVATAAGTTVAIGTAFSKFTGDTGIFPIAKDSSSFENGRLKSVASGGTRVKVLRSGNGKPEDVKIGDSDSGLDPGLETTNSNLNLWKPAEQDISNINRHLVTDDIGYANGNFTWLGPYVPSIDQDPWGRNYLVYVNALNFDNFTEIEVVDQVDPTQKKKIPIKISQIDVDGDGILERIYGWIISAGPDEKLQTAPTGSILKGDDIGTLIAIPGINVGTSSKRQ